MGAGVSVVVHVGLAVLASLTLRGCLPPRSDAPGSAAPRLEARTVISEAVEPEQVAVATESAESTVDAEAAELSQSSGEAAVAEESEATAPVQDSSDAPLLRALTLAEARQSAAGDAPGPRYRPRVRPQRRQARPPLAAATQPSETTGLFGISDRGSRLLYVIDRSESMGEDASMRAAKDELAASIARLQPEQLFQVLFYNTEVTRLQPPPGRSARDGMFRGLPEDARLAADQWASVVPSGGTRHLLPLVEALKYRPDVLFFLTDGDRPGLTLAQLDDLTERNGGRCRIHCIEFGRGGPVRGYRSFLSRLAEANGGQYVYHDTTQFR